VPSDLIAVIKAKQAEISKLQAELEEARALLAGGAGPIAVQRPRIPATSARVRVGGRRPDAAAGAEALAQGSVAFQAAAAIRAAGRPMRAHDLVKAIEQAGHKVKLPTLVGSLSRWVKRRAVFYRAGRNMYGLIELRRK
jgi:hypothetical protein